jgi:hypothetical protein
VVVPGMHTGIKQRNQSPRVGVEKKKASGTVSSAAWWSPFPQSVGSLIMMQQSPKDGPAMVSLGDRTHVLSWVDSPIGGRCHMAERTEHGQERHAQDDRPTAEACADRDNPREVYQDVESGYWVYVVEIGVRRGFLHGLGVQEASWSL